MPQQCIHFSFDDVFQDIKDITEHVNDYNSVFENRLFAWMKDMYDTYGAVFSLYTFNTAPGYDISGLPSKYAMELSANSSWLKFGFHAGDINKKYEQDEPEQITEDYMKFYDAIMHATGGQIDCIDRVIRLHYFAGTSANIEALRSCKGGICGLLAADDFEKKRIAYNLNETATREINRIGEYKKQGMIFLRSQPRMERVTSIREIQDEIKSYTKPKIIELFTHATCIWDSGRIGGYKVYQVLEEIIRWAHESGYRFDFAQNLYETDI